MRRGLPAALCLLALAACGTTTRPPARSGTTPIPTVSEAASPSSSPSPPPLAFSTERALTHAKVLATEIGKRVAGTDGEKRAEEYIARQLQTAGYEVTRQTFTRADGGTSANLMGRAPGVDFGKGYFLVGGHYDTKGESPGGNDNGSGVGAVIALAEVFSRRSVPVEFAGFAAEEVSPVTGKHHEGSSFYASNLADPAQVFGMLSIDMIGNGDRVHLVSWRNSSETRLRKELASIASEIGIPFVEESKGDISDHTPFLRRGVPAAFVWSGEHPTLHKSSDTFEVIQPEAVDRAGRLVLEWLKRRNGITP